MANVATIWFWIRFPSYTPFLGIGTGWSTSIHNYNPREICENMRKLIRGERTKPMVGGNFSSGSFFFKEKVEENFIKVVRVLHLLMFGVNV